MEQTKIYYTINEVAEHLHENASTLRFWEKKFVQIKPKVNQRGVRKYTLPDIELLERIQYLLRSKNLTIEGAISQLKVKEDDVDIQVKVVRKLEALREELIKLRREINANETTSEDIIL